MTVTHPFKSQVFKFNAVLEKGHGEIDSAYVTFPYDVAEHYGTRGQVKIQVTFDGVPYRGVLAPMGGGKHAVGVLQKIRKQIGKTTGDVVSVTLRADLDERKVEVPPVLAVHFKKEPKLAVFFASLSYTNQKEYALWITSAAKEETRIRRLAAALEKLRAGKKNPSEK